MTQTVDTTWETYQPEKHGKLGGNYIFLFRAFSNAPYYTGETGLFGNRLPEHEKLFRACKRTFMRPPFSAQIEDRSHTGFVSRWQATKGPNGFGRLPSLIWVPDTNGPSTEEIRRESIAFWSDEVTLLVFPNSHDLTKRPCIEKQTQIDIMHYYENLAEHPVDWTLPISSLLVGQAPKCETPTKLLYKLGDKELMEPNHFFPELSHMEI